MAPDDDDFEDEDSDDDETYSSRSARDDGDDFEGFSDEFDDVAAADDEEDAEAVGVNDTRETREPVTWFLSPALQDMLKLYGTRDGSDSDAWCQYWTRHPERAAKLEAEYMGQVGQWFADVEGLDIQALGDGVRGKVFEMDQRLRTYVLLAYPMTCAVSLANYVMGAPADPWNHKRELMARDEYRLFQRVRTYVYQQTPHYKAHKKQYDAARAADPDFKAKEAARLRARAAKEAQDPSVLARKAMRKRELRAAKKAATAAAAETLKNV